MQDLAGLPPAAAEQSRTNDAMLSESPAWSLLMLARCTRSAFAPVRLSQPPIRRTRPRSSPTTCWHLMRKRRRSAATVRAACYGCSTKVDNHRFMVVPPCYGLTTLLRRTLIYALGRSGRARRDMGGPSGSAHISGLSDRPEGDSRSVRSRKFSECFQSGLKTSASKPTFTVLEWCFQSGHARDLMFSYHAADNTHCTRTHGPDSQGTTSSRPRSCALSSHRAPPPPRRATAMLAVGASAA